MAIEEILDSEVARALGRPSAEARGLFVRSLLAAPSYALLPGWAQEVVALATEEITEARYAPEQLRDEGGRWAYMGGPGRGQTQLGTVKLKADPRLRELAQKNGMTPTAYTRAANENLAKVLKDAQVQVRVSPSVLSLILADGRLKSQFEAGGSTGMFDPRTREWVERTMFGDQGIPTVDDVEHAEMAIKGYLGGNRPEVAPGTMPSLPSQEGRPIYGYLAEPGTWGEGMLDGYGEVAIVLKDSVRERTTFTNGDTLAHEMSPAPLLRPDIYADAKVIPGSWNYENTTRRDAPSDPLHYTNLHDMARITNMTSRMGPNNYLEAQVHGGVRVSDIAGLKFKQAPSGALFDQIKQSGIPWTVSP